MLLHKGHSRFSLSNVFTMHASWYACLHFNFMHRSPSTNSVKHIAHSDEKCSFCVSPTPSPLILSLLSLLLLNTNPLSVLNLSTSLRKLSSSKSPFVRYSIRSEDHKSAPCEYKLTSEAYSNRLVSLRCVANKSSSLLLLLLSPPVIRSRKSCRSDSYKCASGCTSPRWLLLLLLLLLLLFEEDIVGVIYRSSARVLLLLTRNCFSKLHNPSSYYILFFSHNARSLLIYTHSRDVKELRMSSVAKIEELLKSHLEASHLSIVDTSGSCGSAFEILFCVSPSFHGKNSLTKQRLVTKALEKEMDKIHALSMKKLISPEEYANLSPRSRSPTR